MFRRKRPLEQIVEAKVKSFVEQNNIKTEEVEHILEKLSNHKPTGDLKFSYDKEVRHGGDYLRRYCANASLGRI